MQAARWISPKRQYSSKLCCTFALYSLLPCGAGFLFTLLSIA
jgi:hypothetical protein